MENRATLRSEKCYFPLFKNIYMLVKHVLDRIKTFKTIEKCIQNIFRLSNTVFSNKLDSYRLDTNNIPQIVMLFDFQFFASIRIF